MHLTRKQTILIASLSGVAVLLLVGFLILWSYFRKGDPIPAEPSLPPVTASPSPSETPSPSPTPTETPSPTPYFLPLVPEGAASTPVTLPATPAVSPSPTNAAAPEAAGTASREGVYNDEVKEFMAIGTQDGEAIAILLVQVKPPTVTVVAIPCETLSTVYTLGKDAQVTGIDTAPIRAATARAESEREGCWNLIWAVKNCTGYRAPAFLCVDFACMEAFFSFASGLPAEGAEIDLNAFLRILNERDEARAKDLAELGVGVVQYLSKVSLWELPAFKSATRGSFTSSLSILELLKLMGDLRKSDAFSIFVLPTKPKDGFRVLSEAAVLPF